jgi:hypothetical protein
MTLLGIATAWLGGVALALALDPRARGARLVGLAFPLGIGGGALAMGALSALHVRWTTLSVALAAAAVFGGAGAVAAVRDRRTARAELPPRGAEGTRAIGWAAALLVVAMIAGHASFVVLAPPGEWDFWAIWGLKGKVFHGAAAIDWEWLQRPANAFAHPDYPLLLPLAYDFIAAIPGSWSERELGLLFTAFAASILLYAAAHLREAGASSAIAALFALALAGPVLSLPVGLADLPLLCFAGIALLELRRAGEGEHGLAIAAASLALAALTKNEGIALIVAVAAGIAAAGRWRLLRAVAPAAMAAAAWLAIRSFYGLTTDLFASGVSTRLASTVAAPAETLRALGGNLPRYPLFWLALVLAIGCGGLARMRRERLLLVAIGVQLLFYLGAYVVTPHDVIWHVATSWPRLAAHLMIPLAFVAALFTAEGLGPRRDA